MVQITIKKLLGLKGINAITEKELKDELNSFEKQDFIEFLTSIPKSSISFLFEEQLEGEIKDNNEDII
jgi:hypothetical protein